MIDGYWIPLLPPFLGGLTLSMILEVLLLPRPIAPWRRPFSAVGVHLGVWTILFALELALFRRPYFGAANVLVVQLLIILVSNAKYRTLREPFVYPDFEYFIDAIRHPRLYLPFFGALNALVAGGGYGLALWAGLALEGSMTAGAGIWLALFDQAHPAHMFDPVAPMMPFFLNTSALAALGLILTSYAGRHCRATYDASPDLHSLGLVAALWAYGRAERQPVDGLHKLARFANLQAQRTRPTAAPDLVVIQSESFFDARKYYSALKTDVLKNFDLIKAESIQHGNLAVAAWGANTVRTEFSFLSGMHRKELGVHQYNPYRFLARHGFPTLASYLKGLGYRTICVHPYHRSFYRRNAVLPQMGFDEFIGIEAFADVVRDGPYVGDRALADKVAQLLPGNVDAPIYIHVITMENHGPLHWETVSESDKQELLRHPLPDGCDDLVIYARHLRNADAMFGMLRSTLMARNRPSSLCIYGDHVPIMPAVYKKLGAPAGETDYVLWHSEAKINVFDRNIKSQSCDVADLANTFLSATQLYEKIIKEPLTDSMH